MALQALLATCNQGKKEEMASILEDTNIQLLTLKDFPGLPEAVEDGITFAKNARKKALHFLGLTGIPVIADDSGLEVNALDGAPGVYSARYAETDDKRISRLLRELEEALARNPELDRKARFACAICLAWPGGEMLETFGIVRGRILEYPKGEEGFGYDPVFFYPPMDKTFAEIPADRKNSISHRANALAELKTKLANRTVV
jgi:XTP/dITP diphosphohydrolase